MTIKTQKSYVADMKTLIIILNLCFFSLQVTQAKPTKISAIVEKISDGDTLQVRLVGSKKTTKVRLLGIDTPETDFNGVTQGQAALMARDYLRSLVPLKAEVLLETYSNSEDIHQRLLAVIYFDGIEINLKMLESGMAFTYFIFPYDKSLQKKYALASQLASEEKIGIFTNKFQNLQAPYIFRQEQKGTEGNMVVASESKRKLFHQIDILKVEHYDRVFFAIPEQAEERGFNW